LNYHSILYAIFESFRRANFLHAEEMRIGLGRITVRIAYDKTMPFSPLIPNAETIAAMEEARKGNLPRVHSVKELFEALNKD
jgi:hypothetical protein